MVRYRQISPFAEASNVTRYIRDDLLTEKWENPIGKEISYQAILPKACVPEVLKELQDNRSKGNLNRTLARIRDRERYYSMVNSRIQKGVSNERS